MKRKTMEDLGPLQKRIMEAVWKKGGATVHEVKETIDPEDKLAYTTVLSAMQKLKKEGWLGHQSQGRSYLFLPRMSREKEGARLLRKLVKQIFHRDPMLLFQRLIDEVDLEEDEWNELRNMIDRKKGEKK